MLADKILETRIPKLVAKVWLSCDDGSRDLASDKGLLDG